MSTKFDDLYEKILVNRQMIDLLFEGVDGELTAKGLLEKYENLLENRNMIFHIDTKGSAGKTLHINWYDYFDRSAFKEVSQSELQKTTDRLKPHEDELKQKLESFLMHNQLKAQGDFDFEIGGYVFTYSLYFDYTIETLEQAEALIREAIKMHDKIYRFLRKEIYAIKS